MKMVEVDLTSVFVINSLCWMLLCTYGRKPKENELLQNDIKRTKKYMGRLKQIKDRKLAPRLNQQAAKNFVRNALWDPRGPQSSTSNVIFFFLNHFNTQFFFHFFCMYWHCGLFHKYYFSGFLFYIHIDMHVRLIQLALPASSDVLVSVVFPFPFLSSKILPAF
ncbi:unnamed protein product [Gongylonema pulchrum]|uniref:Nuclear nucleic acid-binding protein C1D n=1 Tax=Gongylonema pulchrum TaxID=637853 RepID=A0A3P6SBC5_9BILA|nr:unnamed protein product [Gongylonema pulchrum]